MAPTEMENYGNPSPNGFNTMNARSVCLARWTVDAVEWGSGNGRQVITEAWKIKERNL